MSILPADSLPDPSGPLSAAVSPAAIREANEAVKGVTGGSAKARGKYAKLTPEQQAAIGEYASLRGNQAAIRHFSKQFGVDVKASSVQTWKGKYVVEINRKRKAGDMNDLSVNSLPVKKRGTLTTASTEKDAILTPAIQRGRGNTRRVTHAKFKIAKISAEGVMAVYAKICTFENFPLYGIQWNLR